jgi:hypothetical protein
MKKYFLSLALLLSTAFLFTSCLKENDEPNGGGGEYTLTVGAFVLNEGNYYNNINGSLDYIDLVKSSVSQGLFRSVNNRSLGGTPNSIIVAGAKAEIYIACTDENRVEITDNKLNSITAVDIPQPREMAVLEDNVYVSSYSGRVYMISTATHKVTATSDIIGANLEGIAVRGTHVYVCNAYNPDFTYNNNVVKLDAVTLKKEGDVTVAVNPVEIKCDGSNLFVLSRGDYKDVKSQLQKIDAGDQVTYLFDAVYFDYFKTNLFAVNQEFDKELNKNVYTFFGYTKEGKKVLIDTPFNIPAPCAINVDPNSGVLFVSSYVMGDKGYPDYSAPGFVYAFSLDKSYAKRFNAGVGPCSLLFNHVTYVKE